jgi:putative transposase
MRRFGASLRQACAALNITRSVYGYRSQARDAKPLVLRIKEITATRVHYGYRRVHVLLRREGWKDNHKRVYRLYRNEGLSLRHKRPRRNKAARLRQPKQLVHSMNEIWSMDFVADALFDGRRIRALTIVDNYTRECLAIEVGQHLTGDDGRQRQRVHLEGDGSLGVRERRGARLLPTGPPDRQREDRILQRPAS